MMQVHAQDLHTNSRPVEAAKMKDEQFARLVRPAARRVTFQVVPFVPKGSLKSLVEATIKQGRFTHRNTSPFLPTAPSAACARPRISVGASGRCDFSSLAQLHQLERHPVSKTAVIYIPSDDGNKMCRPVALRDVDGVRQKSKLLLCSDVAEVEASLELVLGLWFLPCSHILSKSTEPTLKSLWADVLEEVHGGKSCIHFFETSRSGASSVLQYTTKGFCGGSSLESHCLMFSYTFLKSGLVVVSFKSPARSDLKDDFPLAVKQAITQDEGYSLSGTYTLVREKNDAHFLSFFYIYCNIYSTFYSCSF